MVVTDLILDGLLWSINCNDRSDEINDEITERVPILVFSTMTVRRCYNTRASSKRDDTINSDRYQTTKMSGLTIDV